MSSPLYQIPIRKRAERHKDGSRKLHFLLPDVTKAKTKVRANRSTKGLAAGLLTTEAEEGLQRQWCSLSGERIHTL